MQTNSLIVWEFFSQILRRCGYIFVITMVLATTNKLSAADHLSTVTSVQQQQITVTGTVTNKEGEPLPGANVLIKGTTIGQMTNVDGKFTITAPSEDAVLVFSYLGFATQEVIVGNNRILNISLFEGAQQLEELVVVGYGVVKKSDLTGSVGSIKSDEFIKRPITRFEQALQGTTSGMTVTSNNGQPGQGLSIRIRGSSSITGGNDPLYVIDGHIGGSIEALNPNDIESVEILKDASATAIYGSRGTNGVIMVTTKSGKEGKTQINFNTWFSKASIAKHLDLMTAAEFAGTINKSYSTPGSEPFSTADIAELQRTGGTDWHKEIERSPWIQNYDLNISGGTDAIRYRISFNHLDQPGLIMNTWYKKSNMRANFDIKANKRLDFKFNFSYIQPKSRNNNYSGDVYDPFGLASIFDPTSPIYNDDGTIKKNSVYGTDGFNPVGVLQDSKNDRSSQNLVGNGVLNFKITDDLVFTTNTAYSTNSSFDQNWDGPNTSQGSSNGTRATIYSNKSYSFQNSNYLKYNKIFGDHRIDATLLYEQSKYEITWQRGTATRLSTPILTYYNLRLGSTQQTESGYSSDAMQSYMARVNYSFKSRYLLTASIRRDGSSKLTEKYDNFPSVAFAWNIGNESFMERFENISGLKLRASYGETGNQAVGAYSTLATVSTSSPYYFDGTTATTTTPVGSPVSKNLKWEHAKQTDIGLDLVMYNGRLTFTADYYNRNIVDLLYNYRAPFYMGGGTYQTNMGKLNNKGLEFNINAIPVKNKNFFWNSLFILSFNRNKVVNLRDLLDIPSSGIGTFQAEISRLQVGQSLGQFYGYKFLGTWKTAEADEAAKYGLRPGDAKYEDLNGDYAYTADDRQVIGNGTPDFAFGFSNDFQYKNFTLNLLFQGTVGNEIYSQSMAVVWGGHGMARHATIRDALNTWTAEKQTDVPIVGSGANLFNSSRFVYDGSFVKLKNISLTYNVPKRLVSKWFIENLDLFVSAQNLFTVTKFPGYDPEMNNAQNSIGQGVEMGVIPNPRTYTMGLHISF